MKKRNFLMMAASLLFVAAGTIACDKDNTNGTDDPGDPTDKTLIVAPATANFGWHNPAEITLTVTTDAASWTIGSTAAWYTAEKSGDNKIVLTAQSNDGAARTHTLTISAPGAPDATVAVKQDAVQELHASLQGSEYILLQLDDASFSFIESKVVGNFIPDDIEGGNNLFFWEGLGAGTTVGMNFYGYDVGWVALVTSGAAGAGWSGGGYNHGELAAPDFSAVDDDWYFHVAMKGTPETTFELILDCGNGSTGEYKFNVGTGTDWPLSMSEWTEIEIPFSTILDAGWVGKTNEEIGAAGCNSFNFLTGNVDGVELQWDALFLYKK